MRVWGRIGFFVATFIFSHSLVTAANPALPEPAEHITLVVVSRSPLPPPFGLDQIPLPTVFTSSHNVADNGWVLNNQGSTSRK
jgi:hypothetical protein